MRSVLLIFFSGVIFKCSGQLLGGQTVFNFLGNNNTAQYNAMGGKNVSYVQNNSSAFLQNPALWQTENSKYLSVDIKNIYGIVNSLATYTFTATQNVHTAFAVGYNNYGKLTRTDASGNLLGNFNANDIVVMYNMARNKNKPLSYGATFKLANSQIDINSGIALATDVGLHYKHPTNGFAAGFVIKNFGINLKKIGSLNDALPFDMQIGVSKKIAKAPFALSLTMHQLQQFNNYYNDTIFTNALTGTVKKVTFLNKLSNHFVVAVHIIPVQYVTFDVGYNIKMRRELLYPSLNNGLTSLSFGCSVIKKDFVFNYAAQLLLIGKPTHQIQIALPLNKKIF